MANRITIQLIGGESDHKDVRLNDFIEQLKYVKRALAENELTISRAERTTLDYKVVDLRHSSPATVVLQPVPIDGLPTPGLADEVVSSFARELRLIRREGKLLHDPELPRLQAYEEIGAKQKSRITAVRIRAARNVVTIDQKFKNKLNQILGPDEYAEGSITGMLEAVNFHNTNKFTLYPPLGPKKIMGTFPAQLRPAVKDAIGSFVTVSGKLAYKAWSPYPHGVVAENLDVHEPESELPTLTELRGAFAGVTGDLNSVEFVVRIRNEEWQ